MPKNKYIGRNFKKSTEALFCLLALMIYSFCPTKVNKALIKSVLMCQTDINTWVHKYVLMHGQLSNYKVRFTVLLMIIF